MTGLSKPSNASAAQCKRDVPRKVTASRPSSRRWSYVSATTMIGRTTIWPSTTTARSLIECIPTRKFVSNAHTSGARKEAAIEGGMEARHPTEPSRRPPLDFSIAASRHGTGKYAIAGRAGRALQDRERRTKEEEQCSPRTAACGRLMIGVPYSEPKTPPLELRYG